LTLLPDLRRCAAALCGTPKGQADELVLRALHNLWREKLPENEGGLRRKLRASLTRLAQIRALPRPPSGTGAHPWESALVDLPAGHRAALILVTVEGCSYEEAAQILGISRPVLMGRLTAARQMLARSTQDMDTGMRRAPHLRLVK
jgi:RNA polymerase sigma-70 factor (ECF subfamily)